MKSHPKHFFKTSTKLFSSRDWLFRNVILNYLTLKKSLETTRSFSSSSNFFKTRLFVKLLRGSLLKFLYNFEGRQIFEEFSCNYNLERSILYKPQKILGILSNIIEKKQNQKLTKKVICFKE